MRRSALCERVYDLKLLAVSATRVAYMHGTLEKAPYWFGEPERFRRTRYRFWGCLEHIAKRLGAAVAGLAARMDREIGTEALTGALRVFVSKFFLELHPNSGDLEIRSVGRTAHITNISDIA